LNQGASALLHDISYELLGIKSVCNKRLLIQMWKFVMILFL